MVGPWEALVTFQQMIVLADVEGVVDMTPDAISRETTIPIEIIKKGIEALEKPDPESRSPEEEGRRIVRLRETSTWGWRLVNYQYYRNLKREEDRREYHRQYYHDKRKPKTQQKAQLLNKISTRSTYAEAEADAYKNSEKIFRILLKTSGKEPERTQRLQDAIDKIGGMPKILNCTQYDLPAATKAFCEAYDAN
jgi:hypothetical protein